MLLLDVIVFNSKIHVFSGENGSLKDKEKTSKESTMKRELMAGTSLSSYQDKEKISKEATMKRELMAGTRISPYQDKEKISKEATMKRELMAGTRISSYQDKEKISKEATMKRELMLGTSHYVTIERTTMTSAGLTPLRYKGTTRKDATIRMCLSKNSIIRKHRPVVWTL